MKTTVFLLGIPLFAFFVAAATLDPGRFIHLLPEADITAYLAAKSIASDGNLAFTSVDSDRYLKDYGQKPSRFRVARKKILSSNGNYLDYPVFSLPEVFVFALVPFVWMFGFSGWLILHAVLIGLLLWIGSSFYTKEGDESAWPAINALLYYTLILVPVMFLMFTHHLFLFAMVSLAIYSGLKNYPVISAVSLALAISSQPWAALLAVFLIAYWQFTGLKSQPPRYLLFLGLFTAVVFGVEWMMYPPSVSETRWVSTLSFGSVKDVWQNLPIFKRQWIAAPSLQRLAEFVFGRTAGFVPYATVAVCLFLSSIWHLRERLVNRGLAYVTLVLLAVPFVPFSSRGLAFFADDFAILLSAIAFFLFPLARPKWFMILAVALCSFFSGPLLMNPLGALTSRNYYLQSIPYSYFPQELDIIGIHGLTADPAYRIKFQGGTFYFLNQFFYQEKNFIWVRGESTLELVLELDTLDSISHLRVENGSAENYISFHMADRDEFLSLKPGQTGYLDLALFRSRFVEYRGKYYLHGKIHSGSGYVPKLLSRENTDYRYLGCRVQPFSKNTIPQEQATPSAPQ